MHLRLAFRSGGMEILFDNKRKMTIQTPDTIISLGDLLIHLRDQYLTSKPELFMSGSTVRPGVLVLINDTDWELEGECDYLLKENDEITFISTLHGG